MHSRNSVWPRNGAIGTLTLVLLALSLILPSAAPARAQSAPIDQLRAFWVDSLSPGFHNHPQVDELVGNVVRANANTIFVQMRRHGNAWYNNGAEPRAAEPDLAPANEFDPLAYLLEKAHSEGVKVHAWLVISVACRDKDLLRGNPDQVCTAHGPTAGGSERWTTATYRGQQVGDIDLGHPGAMVYMEGMIQTLARNYPALDGIHYDFVRYAGADYGYNDVSVARFNAANGKPDGYRPPPGDFAWSQWRRDRVTEFVRRMYIRLKAINPQLQVSAATITWGGIGSYTPEDWPNSSAYKTVFQDWKAWLQEGILDFAVPMHYFAEGTPRNRDWYNSWLRWDRANTGRRTIVSGIGAWLNNPEQNIAQVQRAITPDEQGRALSGAAFFAYSQPIAGSNPDRRRAFMDQLRATVFAQPARAPVWPWIANPTTGHIQGIATIDGQFVPDAHISLFRNGQWVRDLTASTDGWYGAVDIDPGAYTVLIRRASDGRTVELTTQVRAGLVTST